AGDGAREADDTVVGGPPRRTRRGREVGTTGTGSVDRDGRFERVDDRAVDRAQPTGTFGRIGGGVVARVGWTCGDDDGDGGDEDDDERLAARGDRGHGPSRGRNDTTTGKRRGRSVEDTDGAPARQGAIRQRSKASGAFALGFREATAQLQDRLRVDLAHATLGDVEELAD